MEFKGKLKKLRVENGLSQEALADAVHISRSAIAKYENGNGNPSEETLKALAVYFGVNADDLKSDEATKRDTTKKALKFLGIVAAVIVALGGIVTGTTFGILNYIDKQKSRDQTYGYDLKTFNVSLNYFYDSFAKLYYEGCVLGDAFDSVIQPNDLIGGDVFHFDYTGKLTDPIYSISGKININGRLERYKYIQTEIRNYHSDLGPIKDNLDVLSGLYQIECEYVIISKNGTYISLENYEGSELYISIDYKRMYMDTNATTNHESARPIVAALYSYNPR